MSGGEAVQPPIGLLEERGLQTAPDLSSSFGQFEISPLQEYEAGFDMDPSLFSPQPTYHEIYHDEYMQDENMESFCFEPLPSLRSHVQRYAYFAHMHQSSDKSCQETGHAAMSTFNSPASFMTASSPASFITARSAYNSPAYNLTMEPSPTMRIETILEEDATGPTLSRPLMKLQNDYHAALEQQNLIQPFDKELNWSGKGQHVTFLPGEKVPLKVLSHLGASLTATVEKVLCRRIAIARKTMRCSRKWAVADALREVYHLQNLRHFHIVQLVGSYVQGRNFSILMYPVAECHLGRFLDDTADMEDYQVDRYVFLASSLHCLTSAIAFVHEHTTKHMDIKPQNILVRSAFISDKYISFWSKKEWRVYLADFGLSRSFAAQDHSQTDGPTSRTPRYCAPEVYKYESRGRSSDIFSLGCVFLEILTTYYDLHPHDFAEFRRGDGDDESFHANMDKVSQWIEKLSESPDFFPPNLISIVEQMVRREPDQRPTAIHIKAFFASLPQESWFRSRPCCSQPPETYVVYDETLSTGTG
ncbi:kinase-like protein [Dothidotthia symphoricarpi CBS 119687]|uniref:Kinase-like protein n=1 Tax=Dothidotthia symphoricarpi CBS 119687 TaxID=1392245 RepID=A0A6A6AHC9_9PLEO|nr:kinase-like protein [Dothidotthia symphoricarpi CBS 119687]KAF2130956.1 kinase-like protein [Dothidotthia symphoricarpi CBS 119687]